MTERDRELNELMGELKKPMPYIEEPDEKNVDIGGACFLDQQRVCGPDCTAFTDPYAPTAAERCTILTSMNTGLELLQDLVQLRRPAPRPAAPSIPPPDPMPRHQGGRT
jgi:hypothetical protein